MSNVPSYINKAEDKSAEVSPGSDVGRLARVFRDYRDRKEALEDQLKELNVKLDEISNELGEHMEALGVKSLKGDFGTVYTEIKNRPNVIDKPGMLEWLDANGMGEMAPRAMHPMRLESFVKDVLESNEELPGWVNNFQQTRAKLRRK